MLKPGDVLVTQRPTLNPDAVNNIQGFLSYWHRVKLPKELEADPPWEGGWAAVTAEGKITKRISKWFRELTSIKLSSDDLGIIGNYAADLIVPAGTKVEVTGKFDWDPGDYGDDDSCFFGGRRQSWSYLHKLGGRAAKFYPPERKPGRCLILDSDEGCPVCFNFYGVAPGEGWRILKAVLPDVPVTPTDFRVNNSRSNPIYINCGHPVAVGLELERTNLHDVACLFDGPGLEFQIFCENCHCELERITLYESSYVEGPPAYLCPACYATLQGAQQARWRKAHLIELPKLGERPKPKPRKRVIERALIVDGNTTTLSADAIRLRPPGIIEQDARVNIYFTLWELNRHIHEGQSARNYTTWCDQVDEWLDQSAPGRSTLEAVVSGEYALTDWDLGNFLQWLDGRRPAPPLPYHDREQALAYLRCAFWSMMTGAHDYEANSRLVHEWVENTVTGATLLDLVMQTRHEIGRTELRHFRNWCAIHRPQGDELPV